MAGPDKTGLVIDGEAVAARPDGHSDFIPIHGLSFQQHNWASHGADAWRYLSLSWRAPMREPKPEKVPIGIPLPDMTMVQFMELEDRWSMQEERV
jgi:hypothetical protein